MIKSVVNDDRGDVWKGFVFSITLLLLRRRILQGHCVFSRISGISRKRSLVFLGRWSYYSQCLVLAFQGFLFCLCFKNISKYAPQDKAQNQDGASGDGEANWVLLPTAGVAHSEGTEAAPQMKKMIPKGISKCFTVVAEADSAFELLFDGGYMAQTARRFLVAQMQRQPTEVLVELRQRQL